MASAATAEGWTKWTMMDFMDGGAGAAGRDSCTISQGLLPHQGHFVRQVRQVRHVRHVRPSLRLRTVDRQGKCVLWRNLVEFRLPN